MRVLGALVALLAGCVAGVPLAGRVDPWIGGAGIVDVSPSEALLAERCVFLGGYGAGPTRRAAGVHDPSMARAVFLSPSGNATDAFVLISLDAVGIGNRAQRDLRARVEAATGVPAAAVFAHATHSHSSADLQGLWSPIGGGVCAEYREQVVAGAVAAATQAVQSARAVALRVSGLDVPEEYARNRRDWGFTDTRLTTLDATDAASGAPVATVVNFAAHPTALGADNDLMSGDWPHYTRLAVEEAKGGVALMIEGALGDVTASNRNGSSFEGAENYGRKIAEFALQAMAGPDAIAVDPLLTVAVAPLNHPVSNPLFLAAFLTGILDYDIEDDNTIATQVGFLRLGSQCEAIVMPGESLTRHTLSIVEHLAAPHRLVLGLTTDTLGYLVPSDEWLQLESKYEESIAIDKQFGDAVRDAVLGLAGGL